MKKILMIALCLVLVPMLFAGNTDADGVNKTVVPTLMGPRSLLVDRKPIDFVFSRSDLLFDQHATHYTTFDACQNDSIMGFYPRIADNFTVTSDANVDSLVWWGGYWATMTNSIMDFNIEIYPDSAGFNQPQQNPIYSARVGFTETLISAPDFYYYYEAVMPPFAATAGVTYWIVFQPFLTFPPQWGNNCDYPPEWGDGQEQYFKSPYFGFPDWTPATTVFGRPDETSFQIYGTTGAPAGILYVDDDDDAGLSGYFETSFSNLGIAYDIWVVTDSGDVTPDASVMGTYDIVVWTTGDDWSSTFVGNDTIEVANYFAGGGKMWLSSEDILYDLGPVSWLHVASYTSDIGCVTATGVGPIMTGTSFTTTGGVVFDYSDDISPDAFAWTEMQNETPVDNTIAMDTTTGLSYFLFFNAFAFENIDVEADRDTMMQRVIDWMTAIPTYHDVGTVSIDAPPATITPGTPIDPTATYHNYGTDTETFDIYFVIDSIGVPVYTDNVSVTVDAGLDTTHVFTQWAGGFEGITYDITAYTVLSGDANPGNDTLYQTTYCTSAYWEILDPPLFPLPCAGHSEASTHDGYYYVFGIDDLDTVLVYDIANNQWLDGTTNPYGAGKYGTANAVNGKFYRVGGTVAFPAPLARIDILDPPNTWSAGATPPIGFLDQITGVYNDSLLFVFGSGNWSMTPITDVYFYDTYSDAWTTCTSFPSPGNGALAGGVIDTFAILAFGYVSASNAYSSDYCVGIIDQADPSNITWGSWAPIGAAGCRRVPSGVDPWNKELWVIGGQVSGGQLDRTLSYSPYTDVWTDWAMPKPAPICNVTPIPITLTAAGDLGVFVGGGYTSGYVGDHEVFHTGKDTLPGIEEMPGQETAGTFGFAPSMPNPTKGLAPITYTTTMSGKVSMNVYDNTGRLVRTLVDRAIEPAGTKTVYWNSKDNNHRDVANGIYFIRLEAEENTATHKLVLVK